VQTIDFVRAIFCHEIFVFMFYEAVKFAEELDFAIFFFKIINKITIVQILEVKYQINLLFYFFLKKIAF